MDDSGRISRRALLLGGLGAVVAAGAAGAAVEWDDPRFVRLRGGCGSAPAIPRSDYDLVTGTMTSSSLNGATLPWVVALPPGHQPGDAIPLVLVLHGRGADQRQAFDGVGLTGFATAAEQRFVFAAPGGADGLYWHPREGGVDPLDYALHEFLPMVESRFGGGGAKSRRGVMGWSMGGSGALLAAEGADFAVAVGASPALFTSYDDVVDNAFDTDKQWEEFGVFGHLDLLADVAVRVDCGNADPYERATRQFLDRVPHAVGGIGSGCHDIAFWRRMAPTHLRFLADHLSG